MKPLSQADDRRLRQRKPAMAPATPAPTAATDPFASLAEFQRTYEPRTTTAAAGASQAGRRLTADDVWNALPPTAVPPKSVSLQSEPIPVKSVPPTYVAAKTVPPICGAKKPPPPLYVDPALPTFPAFSHAVPTSFRPWDLPVGHPPPVRLVPVVPKHLAIHDWGYTAVRSMAPVTPPVPPPKGGVLMTAHPKGPRWADMDEDEPTSVLDRVEAALPGTPPLPALLPGTPTPPGSPTGLPPAPDDPMDVTPSPAGPVLCYSERPLNEELPLREIRVNEEQRQRWLDLQCFDPVDAEPCEDDPVPAAARASTDARAWPAGAGPLAFCLLCEDRVQQEIRELLPHLQIAGYYAPTRPPSGD